MDNIDVGSSEPDDVGMGSVSASHPMPQKKPIPSSQVDVGSSERDDEGYTPYGSGIIMSKLGAGKPYPQR